MYHPYLQRKESLSKSNSKGNTPSLHTDSHAAELAQAHRAKALTIGNDIYFGKNQYAPETKEGQGLIAHEMTHVMQQKQMSQPMIQRHADDGINLISPRFAGDHQLEMCNDNLLEFNIGSSGGAVRKIQQALIDLGYDLSEFRADSHYGSETADAVREFQRDFGMNDEQIDGIVGENTLSRLDSRLSEGSAVIPEQACELGTRTIPVDVIVFDGFTENPADYIDFNNDVFGQCCVQLEVASTTNVDAAETATAIGAERELNVDGCEQMTPDAIGLANVISSHSLSSPIKLVFVASAVDGSTRLRGFAVDERCAGRGNGPLLGCLVVANAAGFRTLPHELAHYLTTAFAEHAVTEDNIQHISRGATGENIAPQQCHGFYTRALEESL